MGTRDLQLLRAGLGVGTVPELGIEPWEVQLWVEGVGEGSLAAGTGLPGLGRRGDREERGDLFAGGSRRSDRLEPPDPREEGAEQEQEGGGTTGENCGGWLSLPPFLFTRSLIWINRV